MHDNYLLTKTWYFFKQIPGGAHSVQAPRKQFCSGTFIIIHLHFFTFFFSVVWIGSRSTFVLCTALLTGRLSLSDVLELAILWRLLTVTVTLLVLIRLAGWTDHEYINLIYLTTSGSNCLKTAQSQFTVIQVPHHVEFASLGQHY